MATGDVRIEAATLDATVGEGAVASPSVSALLDTLADAGAIESVSATLTVARRSSRQRGAGRESGASAPGNLFDPARATVAVPPPPPGRGQVLLVHDDEAVRWVLPDAPVTRRRGGARGATTFTLTVDDAPEPSASRGIVGKLIKKGLHVLTFDLIDKVAGEVADHFACRWEEHARPPRLRTFSPDDYTRADVADLDAAALAAFGAGPTLLLVHGTNSRTHTGFGGFSKADVQALYERYGGRVLAFDHPTISVDPLVNARWLVEHLPPDAGLRFDVLAHSRGGLVARSLVERASELGVTASQLEVRQVVFVATPNHGTPLADPRRLGQLLDGLTNLIDVIPDNPLSPALDAVSGVLAVVKQLAVGAFGGLDGLVSMCPTADATGGFLAALNTERAHGARYRAIAADYEPLPGSGLGRIARDTAVDLLFGEANDLIVPTASAYEWNGASAFPIAERVVLPADRAIDHSGYWTASGVREALAAWLRSGDDALRVTRSTGGGVVGAGSVAAPGGGTLVGSGGDAASEPDPFADVDARLAAGDLRGLRDALAALPDRQRAAVRAYVGADVFDPFTRRDTASGRGGGGGAARHRRGAGAAAGATRVYVLPGIMGTLLSVRDGGDTDRIWVNPLRLVAGQFRRLTHTGREQVVVNGPHRTYLRLVMALDRSWDVVPFGFDWRLDLADAAALLAADITAHGAPAHLVAHSMGGLVCRLLYANHRAAWDQLASGGDLSAGGRVVLLGTPSLGSLSIASALSGQDKMVRLLAGADLLNDTAETRQVIASFPGVYDLLPSPTVSVDGSEHAALYDAGRWPVAGIDQAGLDGAKAMHRTLARAGIDAARTLYVAGSGHDTPFAVRIDPDGLRFRTTAAGDGRVTHDSGLGRGANGQQLFDHVWFSPAGHGELPNDATVVAAVDDLLRTGTTTQLSTEPVGLARGAAVDDTWRRGEELEPVADLDVDLARGLDDSVRGVVARRRRTTERARRIVDEATTSWLGEVPLRTPITPALTLTVTHASLEHAKHVVVLGHYAGTPIAGAEHAADLKLGGQLAQHQLLGRYPQQPGDVLRVVAPGSPFLSFGGVAVIGLGEVGSLTPTALAGAVRAAALERALAAIGTPPAPGASQVVIGLSAVPVGSYGPDGLQLPTVVAALLEGVVLANRELAQLDGQPVRIGELEIVELYAARAEALTIAARDVEGRVPASVLDGVELRPPSRLERGEGGRPGAPEVEYGQGMWRRLIVSSGDGEAAEPAARRRAARREPPTTVALSYTSLGARARADVLAHEIDNRLVGSMVESAIDSPRADADVNVALFELLLPNDLKRELVAVENLVLVVDEDTADLPWEAMADRRALSGTEALVTRMGLVRQLKLAERRSEDTGPTEASALVIGNPPTGFLDQLPGAAAEARAVADKLEQSDLRVRRLVYGDVAGTAGVTAASGAAASGAAAGTVSASGAAADVVSALLGGDYQIVHIAAHGGFEASDRDGAPTGGVVLGPGRYLTAREFGQMRRPPALVFLNCCNLGSVSARNPERDPAVDAATVPPQAIRTTTRAAFAASLSRTLMAMGVKAVVAAGWSVDDRAALAFSTVFYDAMLSGESFGEAVTLARAAAHRSDGGASNTWAAYQCYGDPGFRLARARSRGSGTPRFVSAGQLVRAAEELLVQAGDHDADHEWLVGRVRALEAALGVPPSGDREAFIATVRAAAADSWYRGGAVWAALGAAYGECGAFDDAVRCYSVALWCADGAVSLHAVEQLTNLSVRQAAALDELDRRSKRATPRGAASASARVFRDVGRVVEALERLPRSPERLAIVARFRKAEAVAAAPGSVARRRALAAAVRVYDESWQGGGEPYCALVAVQLDALFGDLLPVDRRAALRADIAARGFGDNASGFWRRVGATDLALTNAIVGRRLGRRDDAPLVHELIEGYRAAFDSRSTERETLSPVRHLADLAALAPAGGLQRSLQRLHAALVEIAAAT